MAETPQLGRDDEFRRFLESQWRKWEGDREERGSRTILQMWGDAVPHLQKNVKTRDGWFRRWLEVRFELGDRIVSLGQLSYSELTTDALSLWLAKVAMTAGKRGRPISPGTVEQIRLGLQGMFTYYLRKEEIDRNLLRSAFGIPKTPGHDRIRQGSLTREQVELIASKMPTISGYLARHLYMSACRFSNIRLLQKWQIDYEARELVLVVKGRKQRRVPIGERTIEEMRKLAAVAPGPFVYPSPHSPQGDPIAACTLYRHLRMACEHPDVRLTHVAGERVTFHHFRHGRAREVLSKTHDITQVKSLLTHSNIRTTQRYLGEDLIRAELHKTIKDD